MKSNVHFKCKKRESTFNGAIIHKKYVNLKQRLFLYLSFFEAFEAIIDNANRLLE
ncbi:hypothetical protein RO3G_17139 [Rhizopus delemar RA 99-880]|uniref:Uncharacterized protein n=1 Tax=Rhizopus delemar (strain RA 99-880 / ATCC MYA-4621 / FGSC 9543 / NRRL 43880) TaxID=246409 RepID=I1CVR1_RHIO9|nr:hypothetical protein RO3G_17139 [Rhizopus delemar RA 99-880]|eukprot:EIE92541.1 hypothetical protein RO3G_17139 [Rhizopus delemar RA 99-880]